MFTPDAANCAKIWDLANIRFFQCIASQFKSRTKFYQIGLIAGFIVYLYLDFSNGEPVDLKIKTGKYFWLGFALFFAFKIFSRQKLYEGYFEGYGKGFEDASTRNCDYWGDTHDQDSDDDDITQVMIELLENEARMSEEHKAERKQEVDKGLSKYSGFSLKFKTFR